MRIPTLAVWVHLPLGMNVYLVFNPDTVNSVWKTDEGEAENIALLIFVLWSVNEQWWWGTESLISGQLSLYLFPAKILAEGTLWHVVWLHISTFYFYDFCHLEIYKNLGLPLSTITFTENSHADNHFYKYICLFQILYSMK